MWRSYDASQRIAEANPAVTLPAETLKDRGMYAQLLWGIKPRIVAGLRGEFASGVPWAFLSGGRRDPAGWAPDFPWVPAVCAKFRMHGNSGICKGTGPDHWLVV